MGSNTTLPFPPLTTMGLCFPRVLANSQWILARRVNTRATNADTAVTLPGESAFVDSLISFQCPSRISAMATPVLAQQQIYRSVFEGVAGRNHFG